ncbi:hypothetical protein EDC01DRAFT_787879 [Geopyxis carbonaria]|nr:hypothetical protein EDC01DRAFT_787879 [Geopyxis carbonaria]
MQRTHVSTVRSGRATVPSAIAITTTAPACLRLSGLPAASARLPPPCENVIAGAELGGKERQWALRVGVGQHKTLLWRAAWEACRGERWMDCGCGVGKKWCAAMERQAEAAPRAVWVF